LVLPVGTRRAPDGTLALDYRAVFALAAPLMANNAIQVVFNLTDTWFIGRISTEALAAMAAVQWLSLVVIVMLGGVSQAAQTLAARAAGGRRWSRAAHAAWTCVWAVLLLSPLFVLASRCGHLILAPFGLDPTVQRLAVAFWFPRILGAPIGLALYALLGFFNGVARPRVALATAVLVALLNAALNPLFIFVFGLGIAGAAWATNVAQLIAVSLVLRYFLNRHNRQRYLTHATWRPNAGRLRAAVALGLPMGILVAADVLGLSFFQIIEVRAGLLDGAATQVAMMLTSVAYLPGLGLAQVGTTLVAQAIGAGQRAWAATVGTRLTVITAVFMGVTGILLACAGPWLARRFMSPHDPLADATARLAAKLLWFAALYQFFDGLNLGSSFSLRGAGDVRVPALIVAVCSLGIFAPLSYILTFAPGQGWFDSVPALGFGAAGGWSALVLNVFLVGGGLWLRWRSRAWERLPFGAARAT
jgi:MATE family multidrug resistance protein